MIFFPLVFKIVGFYFYVDSKIESAEISHLPQLPLMCGLCCPIPKGTLVVVGELHWCTVINQSLEFTLGSCLVLCLLWVWIKV